VSTEKPAESTNGRGKESKLGWADNDEALFYELILHTSGTACNLIEQFEGRSWLKGRKHGKHLPISLKELLEV
jgi:hypothetical protein